VVSIVALPFSGTASGPGPSAYTRLPDGASGRPIPPPMPRFRRSHNRRSGVPTHGWGGATTAAFRARGRPQGWGGLPPTLSTKSAYEPILA